MPNHFVLPREQYKRNTNIINAYLNDVSSYLSKMTGDPVEVCREYVLSNMKPGGIFPLNDPAVQYLSRGKNGDRSEEVTRFSQYLDDVYRKERILAPTLTVYENSKVKKSLLATYIGINLKKRKKFKHEMFVYEMKGDAAMQTYFDNLQNSCKIKNNSLSGAHASPHSVLYNKSSHSTLTSTCRSATSIANAHNEKFLMGNRHYWSPDVIMSNILHICSIMDAELLERVMTTYNLHYPTHSDVMDCITYSSNLYWRHTVALKDISDLVEKLTPLERAAFVYLGDMYHLRKHNDAFVRGFFDEMIQEVTEPIDTLENADKVMEGLTSDMTAYVSLIRSDLMAGEMLRDVKKNEPDKYRLIAATAKYITTVLDKYELLITGLWRPNTFPASIFNIESMVRRCVAVSDTDSTIFSNQDWCNWYMGRIDFTQKSLAIAYTTTYITSQIVIHLLAMYSANLGVAQEQTHQLTMKNEYFFPTFVITPRAKHYFAYVSAREGNVFKKMKMEIKGVEMRSSNAPVEVMQDLEVFMKEIMSKIMEKGTVTVDEVVGRVARIEQEIIRDIQRGGFKYMRMMQIKDASSYIDGEDATPFMHYKMWEEVFAPKYGNSIPPPYPVVKISVILDKRKNLENWLLNMPDKELSDRMRNWLATNNKDKITGFMLPKELLELNGIPSEIIPAINLRELIYGVMSPFYLVLESMGFYMINDKLTRLVSDMYQPN